MKYFKLFLNFLKLGLFSFGGAYSGIPLTREIIKLHYSWISDELFANIIAISESTPGSIIVNLSTYIGLIVGGLKGAIIATLASILPAFIITIIIFLYFTKYLKKPIISKIMHTIRIAIIAIIMATGIYMLYEEIFYMLYENIYYMLYEDIFYYNFINIIIDYKDFLIKLLILIILIMINIVLFLKKKRINSIFLIIISAILSIIINIFLQ